MWFILIVIFLMFALVVLKGAPFLISHQKAVDKALDLMELEPGQTVIDLGSGSGLVLDAAARRGLNAIGYELNPLLVLYSKARLWHQRDSVQVIWGDYWKADLPAADGLYVFLLSRYMSRFHDYLKKNTKRPMRVVSYTAEIPGAELVKEEYGLFVYDYR